jgi:hypothetical protein
MEFAYRATPTRKSESVLDAFRRLAVKYDIVAGDLFPQARSVGDLEPLREICTNASAFVLDVPLKIAPGRHWAALQKKVDARGTRGLELLFVGYGTVETTVEPWKAPGLAISTPIERAVRTGFDFAAGRVGFEVSLDRSRAASKPTFRANEARITSFLDQHQEDLFRQLPAGRAASNELEGHRWATSKARGGRVFLTRWLSEHAGLNHLTIHARGTAAALFDHAELFPEADSHHVMAFIDEAIELEAAIAMFGRRKTYKGLLSFSVGAGDNAEGLNGFSLLLSKKGLVLEVTALDELDPKVGKALGLRFELADID